MSTFITIVLVILILGVLIFIHELGHFLAARLVNASVLEFSLGFGPKIISKEYKGTVYSIRLLPLGGFVNILGDGDPGKVDKEQLKKVKQGGNLKDKSRLAQIFVMLAGILMNIFLAIACYFVVLGFSGWRIELSYEFVDFDPIGAEIVKERESDVPYEVVEGSLADQSYMPDTGYIKEINGQRVEYSEDISGLIEGNDLVDILACSEDNTCDVYKVEVGDDEKIGIAIGVNYLVYIDYSNSKVFAGFSHLINDVRLIGRILNTLLKEAKETGDYTTLSQSVSGPVGMFFLVDYFKDLGWIPLVSLIADLSLSLAIMNVLPIPALDGGRVLIIAIESVLRKDLDPKVEAIIINTSFIILIVFVVFIMIKDIITINELKSLFE